MSARRSTRFTVTYRARSTPAGRLAVSGRCCRFEEYGHRLYVTTLELAAFVAAMGERSDGAWDGTGCPYQRSKLCTVHAIRPFGCRMFFCDATSTQWQNDAYERFHARLKALHAELNVPYFYVEWRAALRARAWQPLPPRRPCLSCKRRPGCVPTSDPGLRLQLRRGRWGYRRQAR